MPSPPDQQLLRHNLNLSEPAPSLGSILLAAAAGAYVFFKALELLGFPVQLWLHQLAQMNLPTSVTSGMQEPQDDSTGEPQKTGMQRRLSTVLGLGSGVLQKAKGVTGALTRGDSNAPAGLGNWDNSCYQNSVIQGLASMPSLRDYLAKTTTEHSALDDESTNGALFELINKLNDTKHQGQHFWIRGKLKSMSTFQQQDAQEYYSTILDALDKEVQNLSNRKRQSRASFSAQVKRLSGSLEPSAAEESSDAEDSNHRDQPPTEELKTTLNPLDGYLAQRVGCTACGFTEGLSLVPFNCLTVPLGRLSKYDIRECLDEYTQLEYIENVECAKCTALRLKATLVKLGGQKPGSPYGNKLRTVQEVLDEEDFDDKTMLKKCGLKKQHWTQSTKSRQAVIARAPKALVLHVNRSIFDEMTFAQLKNHAAVSYPMALDLGSWCLGSKPSQSRRPDDMTEEWPRDPTRSMLETDSRPTNSPFQYRLKAAVTHYGSHGNGHYVCYRQHPSNLDHMQETLDEAWWRFSDESVYAVSEAQAHQGNVFMLFYERIDEASPMPQAVTESTQAPVMIPDEAPLPPAETYAEGVLDDSAAQVPLPDDEDVIDSPLAGAPTVEPPRPTSAYPTPPPSTVDTEISEADSEEAPSTLLTSDDEQEADDTEDKQRFQRHVPTVVLRTAGGRSTQTDDRMTAPMVAAS